MPPSPSQIDDHPVAAIASQIAGVLSQDSCYSWAC